MDRRTHLYQKIFKEREKVIKMMLEKASVTEQNVENFESQLLQAHPLNRIHSQIISLLTNIHSYS